MSDSELHFIRRDDLVSRVMEKLMPAREAHGLPTCDDSVARSIVDYVLRDATSDPVGFAHDLGIDERIAKAFEEDPTEVEVQAPSEPPADPLKEALSNVRIELPRFAIEDEDPRSYAVCIEEWETAILDEIGLVIPDFDDSALEPVDKFESPSKFCAHVVDRIEDEHPYVTVVNPYV